MTRALGTAVFVLAALVLLVGAVLMARRAFQLYDPLAFFLPLMLLVGSLAAHFTFMGGVVRWWVVAAGGAMYAAGAVVTWRTGWLP